MKRRSLLSLAGIGLLSPAVLAACSSGNQATTSSTSGPASASAASTPSATPMFLETLRAHVPTTLAYMAPMTSFGQHGHLDTVAKAVTVENWASTDVLKALLVNGETELAAVPSYVPANLFNKGVDVRLLAIQVWGMLYVIGPEGSSAQGLEALRGATVAIPMPNDMPDLIFRYLMGQKGWDVEKDLTIQPYASGQEALSALLTGAVEYAVLPEHPATVAIAKAKSQGAALERTANLQETWAEVTGTEARFPMAGLAVPSAIAADDAMVSAILNELEACVATTNEASQETVQAIATRTEVDAAIVTQVIPRLQLDLKPAAAVRTQLEDFYTRLSTLNPDIIGGGLPAEEFYVADPR